MPKNSTQPLALLCFLILLLLLSGCSSKITTLYKPPPEKYEKLGKVSGTGTGSLGVCCTAYYVFPMGLNSRVEKAYNNALAQAPGATSLINVTYEESWFWWIIGTARTVTVTGEAIKEIK